MSRKMRFTRRDVLIRSLIATVLLAVFAFGGAFLMHATIDPADEIKHDVNAAVDKSAL